MIAWLVTGCDDKQREIETKSTHALIQATEIILAGDPDFILSNEDHSRAVTRYVSACWLEAVSDRAEISYFAAEAFNPIGTINDLRANLPASGVYVSLNHFDDLIHVAAGADLLFAGYDHRRRGSTELPAHFAQGGFNQRAYGGAEALLELHSDKQLVFAHTGSGHPDQRWRDTPNGRAGWLGAQLGDNARVVSIANHAVEPPAWVAASLAPCGPAPSLDRDILVVALRDNKLYCVDPALRPEFAPVFNIYTVQQPGAPSAASHTADLIPGCRVRQAVAIPPHSQIDGAADYRITVRQTDALGRLIVTWDGRGEAGQATTVFALTRAGPLRVEWTWTDPESGETLTVWEDLPRSPQSN